MTDFLSFSKAFAGLLVSMVITSYCMLTAPAAYQRATAKKPKTQNPIKTLQAKIDSTEKEELRAVVVLEEKKLQLIENSYNELFLIAKSCLQSENEILHLKPVVIFANPKPRIDSVKRTFIIKPYK